MDLLQIATGITKCDDYYKLRQYTCLKNKEGALASPEPLFGPRSANAIKPLT